MVEDVVVSFVFIDTSTLLSSDNFLYDVTSYWLHPSPPAPPAPPVLTSSPIATPSPIANPTTTKVDILLEESEGQVTHADVFEDIFRLKRMVYPPTEVPIVGNRLGGLDIYGPVTFLAVTPALATWVPDSFKHGPYPTLHYTQRLSAEVSRRFYPVFCFFAFVKKKWHTLEAVWLSIYIHV